MNRKHILVIFLLVMISVFVNGATTSSTSVNFLSKSTADRTYCNIDGSNCNLGGSASDSTFINIESSLEREVLWNISQVEETEYNYKLRSGRHWVISGGEI